MDIISSISIISGLISVVLAVVAIWLSFHQKKETDAVNHQTKEILIDIRSDAKTISSIAMPELKAYGESMRNYVFSTNDNSQTEKLDDIIKGIKNEFTSILRTGNINNEIANKIKDLESKFIESQKLISPPKNFDDELNLKLDVTDFNHGYVDTKLDQFVTMQQFLDFIYFNFVKETVDVFSYGQQWVIVMAGNEKRIPSKGRNDRRSLQEAGINGGIMYRVRLL